MQGKPEQDRRLLVTAIDQLAKGQPQSVWVSIPRDDEDLSKGFVDITYLQFSNAINHASAWLNSTLGSSSGSFETFAYEGPKDIRAAILAVAAAKVERKFVPSHIEKDPSTLSVRYSQSQDPSTRCYGVWDVPVCRSNSGLGGDHPTGKTTSRGICVPPLSQWIRDKAATPYAYTKSWEETEHDPWLIFHTSGTTGPPKPVIYTQLMMTSLDLSQTFPDADDRTSTSCFVGRRIHSTIPMNHLVGMTGALQYPLWLGTILVLGLAMKPFTALIVDQIIQFGNIVGLASPPFLIRDLCRQPETFERLKKLRFVQWAGAPLDQTTGDTLSQHMQLAPAIGTTECGPYFTRLCDDPADWNYYWFREGQGIELESVSNQFHELIFRREQTAHWQQVFLVFPDLEIYRTNDLFRRHPTKDYLWSYAGRTDDVVMLANGEAIRASDIEGMMMEQPAIRSAVLGGSGQNRAFLLLELNHRAEDPTHSRDEMLSHIRPAIDAANKLFPEFARLSEDFVLFTDAKKLVPRSTKDSVLRKETLELYGDEIEALYARTDPQFELMNRASVSHARKGCVQYF